MPEWLPLVATIVVGLIVGLIAIIYRALVSRIEKLEARPVNGYAALEERIKVLRREVGDRNSGLRKQVHDHDSLLGRMDERISQCCDRLDVLEERRDSE